MEGIEIAHKHKQQKRMSAGLLDELNHPSNSLVCDRELANTEREVAALLDCLGGAKA